MEISDEQYQAFFGNSSYKYLPLARKFENGERLPFKFNAFLLGYFWIFYRKINRFAYLTLLSLLCINTIFSILFNTFWIRNQEYISKGILLIYMLMVGLFGNHFYLKNARSKIIQILNEEPEESIALLKIKKKGGVSWISVSIVCLFQIGIYVLAEYAQSLN